MNQERNIEHKNRIAFCIPTKNRYLCMKELLEYLEDKKDICPMDIFIYDSSDDDKTKELVGKFEYHGGKIAYIDMDDYQGNIANRYTAGTAIKVYQIYKDFSDKDHNPSELMKLPVRTFDEIKHNLNDTGIIIGINKENNTGIKENLLQYIDENDIFFEDDWRMVAY